jgi:putative transposon-encoded protein
MALNSNIETSAFVDAVVNPFGASKSARVPDQYCGNSVCLTDWSDTVPQVGGTAGVAYSGMAYIFLPGYSNLKATYAATNTIVYDIWSLPIVAADSTIGLTAASKIVPAGFTNYATITGSSSSVDADDCLCDAFRIFAAGIRCWPTTEVVTDTSVVHVTRFYGGTITPNTVYRSIVDGTNFISVLKNIDSIKMFPAQDGVTVRYNPFQTPKRILDMTSLVNWNMQAVDWSGVEVPIILSQFSASVTGVSGSAMVYLNSRIWIEGNLSLPTPIYSNASPLDLRFDLISQVMSRPSTQHPLVVSGHTFEAFRGALNSVSSAFDLAATAAEGLGVIVDKLDNRVNQNRLKRRANNGNRSKAKKGKRKRKIAQMTFDSKAGKYVSIVPRYGKKQATNFSKRVKNT